MLNQEVKKFIKEVEEDNEGIGNLKLTNSEEIEQYLKNIHFNYYKYGFCLILLSFILSMCYFYFVKDFDFYKLIGNIAFFILCSITTSIKIKDINNVKPLLIKKIEELPLINEKEIYLNNLYKSTLKVKKQILNDLKINLGLLLISFLISLFFMI